MRPDRQAPTPAKDRTPELEEVLRRGLSTLGLSLSDPMIERLLGYLSLLTKWNAVYNLTAVRDPQAMLVQHVLDSLSVVPPLREILDLDHARIADIGSGAGLPGLLLAVTCPAAQVLSIEPVGKKTAFQRQATAELALTNVEVITARAESVHQPVDLVVSRAFATLSDLLSASAGLIGPQTIVAALKGQRAGIDAECAALPDACSVAIRPVKVPGLDAQRHLVLIRPAPSPRPIRA